MCFFFRRSHSRLALLLEESALAICVAGDREAQYGNQDNHIQLGGYQSTDSERICKTASVSLPRLLEKLWADFTTTDREVYE